MDKPRTTPKDFFLWAGAMVALYWSVIAFIFLVFNYIDYAFPNALSYLAQNPYDSGVGNEMAAIVVLFPVYVVLMWLIRRDAARDISRKEIWVRRWALILTLFLAGVSIAGDLIVLLSTSFSGNELTAGFLLKTLILLLVAAGIFMHFIADFWGYWDKNLRYNRFAGAAAGLLLALTVIAGFVMFGTPWQAREYRLDAQRVADLRNVQLYILQYWQSKDALPANLTDLNDPISSSEVPTDPQSGSQYGYKITGTTSFELCADFNASDYSATPYTQPEPANLYGVSSGGGISDYWGHAAGYICFDRTIDPQRYPPINTKTP
jgi:hypothetical protein